MLRQILLTFALLLLNGCGGGGSSSSTSSTPANNVTPTAPITFSQKVLNANVQSGTSGTVSIQADVNDRNIFAGASAIYVLVADTNKVLNGAVNLTALSNTQFSVTFITSSKLAPGKYSGNFEVHICKNTNCTSEFVPPLILPYEFNISPTPLTVSTKDATQITIRYGSPKPVTVQANVTSNTVDWSASSDAPWLELPNIKGTGPGSFEISISAKGLPVNTYTGKVTISTPDGQTFPLNYVLNVLPAFFSITSGLPSFNAINGETVPPQVISFERRQEFDSLVTNWTATSSADWLIASALSGKTPSSVSLYPNPSIGNLATGKYSAQFTVRAPNMQDFNVPVALTLTTPSLTSAQTYINFGGANGRDWSPQSLTFQLNTGTNSWPWKFTVLPPWLKSEVSGGKVNASGASAKLLPDPLDLQKGTKSAAVSISATINGDTVTLPVTANINIDQRKLLVSEYGVSFSSTPLGKALSRTIAVSDNFGRTLNWKAMTESNWLSVTTSGSTPSDKLMLTANPEKMADGLQEAIVTISSPTPGVEPVMVRVGAWKSNTPVPSLLKLSADYRNIVADKTRPYIYVNNGGRDIDVFNVYTGTKVSTLTSIYGNLSNMAVSPDGTTLYAINSSQKLVDVFNLMTMRYQKSLETDNGYYSGWDSKEFSLSLPLIAIRPNNVNVLVLGHGRAYVGENLNFKINQSLSATFAQIGAMEASSDGRILFTQNIGINPGTTTSIDVDYTTLFFGNLLLTKFTEGTTRGSISDAKIATNIDGSKLYTAADATNNCSVVNPKTMMLIGNLSTNNMYPNVVNTLNDGRVICGRSDSENGFNFWLYDSNGTPKKSYQMDALKARRFVVMPDSLMAAGLTTNPSITFINVAP